MPGGLENPLGARALYLFQNGLETLYRLHHTNVPEYRQGYVVRLHPHDQWKRHRAPPPCAGCPGAGNV